MIVNYIDLVRSLLKIITKLPSFIIENILHITFDFVSICTQYKNGLSIEKKINKIKMDYIWYNGIKKFVSFKVQFDYKNTCVYKLKKKSKLKLKADKYLKYCFANYLLNNVDERDELAIMIELNSEAVKNYLIPFLKKDYKIIKRNNKYSKIRKGFMIKGIPIKTGFIDIEKLNRSCLLLCNRISRIFPTPIIKIIESYIIYNYTHDYDDYEGYVKEKSIVKNIVLDVRKKKLISVFITFTDKKLSNDYIIRVYSSSTNMHIHKIKYAELLIKRLIMTHDIRIKDTGNVGEAINFYLSDFSSSMEKFVYDVLKRTFKPKLKLYNKVFDF